MGPDVEGGELLQILQDVGRVAPPHAELAGGSAGPPGGVAVVLAGRRRGDCREEEGDKEGQPRRRPDEDMAAFAHVFGGAFPAERGCTPAIAVVGGRHGLNFCLWDPARAKKDGTRCARFSIGGKSKHRALQIVGSALDRTPNALYSSNDERKGTM